MAYKTDIEIAQETEMLHINEIAKTCREATRTWYAFCGCVWTTAKTG